MKTKNPLDQAKGYKENKIHTLIPNDPHLQIPCCFFPSKLSRRDIKAATFHAFLRFLPTKESCYPRRVPLTIKGRTQVTPKRVKSNCHRTLALMQCILLLGILDEYLILPCIYIVPLSLSLSLALSLWG